MVRLQGIVPLRETGFREIVADFAEPLLPWVFPFTQSPFFSPLSDLRTPGDESTGIEGIE